MGRFLFVFVYKGKNFYRGASRQRAALFWGGCGVGGRFLRDGSCSQLPKSDEGS